MKEEIRNIKSGQGLGILLFGMKRDQVKEILGDPNETDVYSYTELENDKTENWHFDDYELSVSFSEEEDWKLDTIAINSNYYLLNNESLIGRSIDEVKELLKKWDIDDLEFEDWSSEESPDHKLLISDALEINFWFDEGKLAEIQWGPLFKDEETIIWPM